MLSLNCHFFKRRARTEYLYDHYRPRHSAATLWLLRIIKTLSLIALGIVLGVFIMLLGRPAHADSADYFVSTNNISEVSPSHPVEKSLNKQAKSDSSSQKTDVQPVHNASYAALRLIIACALLLLVLINQFAFSRKLKFRIL